MVPVNDQSIRMPVRVLNNGGTFPGAFVVGKDVHISPPRLNLMQDSCTSTTSIVAGQKSESLLQNSKVEKINVDYFAPIQSIFDNTNKASQLTSLSQYQQKPRQSRKRSRVSGAQPTSTHNSQLAKYNPLTSVPVLSRKRTASRCIGNDFNTSLASLPKNQPLYIPSMGSEEKMGRFFDSMVHSPAEPIAYKPVTDDTHLQLRMFSYDDTKKEFVRPNPETDDYLESIGSRFQQSIHDRDDANGDFNIEDGQSQPLDKKRRFEIETHGNIVDFMYDDSVRFTGPSDTNLNRMMIHTRY